jgi:hypothetical protein
MPCGPFARLRVKLEGAAAPTELSALRRSSVVDGDDDAFVVLVDDALFEDEPPQAAVMSASAPTINTNDVRMRGNVVPDRGEVAAP